jgi:hypothetical protein
LESSWLTHAACYNGDLACITKAASSTGNPLVPPSQGELLLLFSIKHLGTDRSRYTFAWIRPLLDQARKSRGLEYDDLPALGHATRSQDLDVAFPSNEVSTRPLWRVIVSHHFARVCQQWSVAAVESFISVIPAVCMWKLLSTLENPTSLDPTAVWLWVISLALSKILHVGLENWLEWISFAMFAMPVRSQLSAAIFAKSLRMVTVQADTSELHPAKKELSDHSGESEPLLAQKTADSKLQAEDEEPASTAAKGIINLLGVDVQRVSDFCGYNQDLFRGVVKVAIAAGFLVKLLGWWRYLHLAVILVKSMLTLV